MNWDDPPIIKAALSPTVPGGDAFRAGYNVLFTLCEELLSSECSVLVDMSMG